MKKIGKKDKSKIVKRYISKYQEYSKMTNEELVAEQSKKMSSTDSLALKDSIQTRMKHDIMEARATEEQIVEQTAEGITITSTHDNVMPNEETIDIIHEEIRQEEASKDEAKA